MREGIHLFNEQKYWECHEALEEIWMEDSFDNVRNVYWAVIQVAASLIHYRDGKIVGAKGLINKSKEKIKRCEDFKIETPLLEEYLEWSDFKNLIRQVPDEPILEDFKNLFNFRFKKYPY
jgi:predicted metal-dependent hydrolase